MKTDEEIIEIWKKSEMCYEIEKYFGEECYEDFQNEFVELVKKCSE